MTKGIQVQRRQVFIEAMIPATTLEEQIAAYRKAFPACKKDETARAASYRLLQEVDIKEAIEAGKAAQAEIIATAQKEQLIEEAKRGIADVAQMDARLSSIVLGTYRRKRSAVVFNPVEKKFQTVTVEEEPSAAEIIAAVDKLYKRFGKYAPKQLQHEGGDSLIDFLKQITNLNDDGNSEKVSPTSD